MRAASAEETQGASQASFFIPKTYPTAHAWREDPYDFKPDTPDEYALGTANTQSLNTASDPLLLNDDISPLAARFKEEDLGEAFLKQLPYKEELSYTWKVVKGDVDIYFENLRVDRGNRGLTYKSNYIPFMGESLNMRWKAELGKDNQLTFTSDTFPVVGPVKGLQFRAKAGEDNAVSLRYRRSLR